MGKLSQELCFKALSEAPSTDLFVRPSNMSVRSLSTSACCLLGALVLEFIHSLLLFLFLRVWGNEVKVGGSQGCLGEGDGQSTTGITEII